MEATIGNTREARELTTPNLVAGFRDICQRTKDKTIESAKVADQAVRMHPYQAIGIAAGVGLLFGLLLGRRWRS